jgi:hypothetical protein
MLAPGGRSVAEDAAPTPKRLTTMAATTKRAYTTGPNLLKPDACVYPKLVAHNLNPAQARGMV